MNRIASMIFLAMTLIPASAVGQVCAKQIEVPKYQPVAVAAQSTGSVDLKITVGALGQVARVEASGSSAMLVEMTKENVKDWTFCIPKKNESENVRLRYEYRLEGARVYPLPNAKVVIDLGAGTVVITSPPMEQGH